MSTIPIGASIARQYQADNKVPENTGRDQSIAESVSNTDALTREVLDFCASPWTLDPVYAILEWEKAKRAK